MPSRAITIPAGGSVLLIGKPAGRFAKVYAIIEGQAGGGTPLRAFTYCATLTAQRQFLYDGDCPNRSAGVFTALVKTGLLDHLKAVRTDCT